MLYEVVEVKGIFLFGVALLVLFAFVGVTMVNAEHEMNNHINNTLPSQNTTSEAIVAFTNGTVGSLIGVAVLIIGAVILLAAIVAMIMWVMGR